MFECAHVSLMEVKADQDTPRTEGFTSCLHLHCAVQNTADCRSSTVLCTSAHTTTCAW